MLLKKYELEVSKVHIYLTLSICTYYAGITSICGPSLATRSKEE